MAQAGQFALHWPEAALIAGALCLLGALPALLLLRHLQRVRRERDEAQRLLQPLERELADQAVYLLDAAGRVTHWSAPAERLHGYAAAEVLGRHYGCLHTEEQRAGNVPQQTLELAAREGWHRLRVWRVRQDGTRWLAQVCLQALRDRGGRLIGFSSVERDVTERAQLLQALQQARAALAQAQMLAAVGRLSAGVAHEFSNVVHIVRTCVELLQRPPLPPARAAELLQMIKRNAARAASLSQQLLELTRRVPPVSMPTDVNAVVTEVVALLRQTFDEQIAVDLRVDEGLCWAQVNRAQLQAALVNLAAEVRDEMGAGGMLSLATGDELWPPAGAAGGARGHSRRYVVISLMHRGAPAPAAGNGLGAPPAGGALEMARSFLEPSGGRLSREVQEDGATIRMYLPRPGQQPTEAPPPPLSAPWPPGRS